MLLVSDIPENFETIGDAGFSFKHGDSEDLKAKLQFLLENPELVEKAQKAMDRIQNNYDWNAITNKIERIYASLAGRDST